MKIIKFYEEAIKSCIICNSCRYCEGLCAVFPAMEKKREFNFKDVDYLANLCHQCSECFYDCQYAPPHEFNVSIPKQFSKISKESYKKYSLSIIHI
ncbi:MAG: citrate utilization protein B, partial [Helicobacter sp.]|nr:citrate utilization protein B [Helicobacter sp.]